MILIVWGPRSIQFSVFLKHPNSGIYEYKDLYTSCKYMSVHTYNICYLKPTDLSYGRYILGFFVLTMHQLLSLLVSLVLSIAEYFAHVSLGAAGTHKCHHLLTYSHYIVTITVTIVHTSPGLSRNCI